MPHVQQGLCRRRWLPDERSATLACTSASAVSVLGIICRSIRMIACYCPLLRCFAVITVSEHEADDELEAVAVLRGKPRPQPPSVRQ